MFFFNIHTRPTLREPRYLEIGQKRNQMERKWPLARKNEQTAVVFLSK